MGNVQFDRKRDRPPEATKTEPRRSFQKHYDKAISRVKRCNQPQSVQHLYGTLEDAVRHLEYCLEMRPGNNLLMLQHKICSEILAEMARTRRPPNHVIPLVLDPAWKG
ncbi:hypothetical protein JW905_18810 [bacterium]|nr:hypothetical protein [candidate division CSSED10-310 bacterium]